LVKNDKIIYPQNSMLSRETEDGIEEISLVPVKDEEAKKIAEAHASFLNK
jgi:hypothetical protein